MSNKNNSELTAAQTSTLILKQVKEEMAAEWLGGRIREALAEPAEPVTLAQFEKNMKAIAEGREKAQEAQTGG
jgi:hypothetical protein